MTHEAEIASLLEQAAPLRCLPPEEAEQAGLGRIVEQINGLRGLQAKEADAAYRAALMASLTPEPAPGVAEPVKRGPGRPKKAD